MNRFAGCHKNCRPSGFNYFSFAEFYGNAQPDITDTSRLLRFAHEQLNVVSLDDITVGDSVTLGHHDLTEMTGRVEVYPASISVL